MRTWLVPLCLSLSVIGAACQQAPNNATPSTRQLEEGEPAPSFELESPTGDVSLTDYRDKKAVLLYFSMGPG